MNIEEMITYLKYRERIIRMAYEQDTYLPGQLYLMGELDTVQELISKLTGEGR